MRAMGLTIVLTLVMSVGCVNSRIKRTIERQRIVLTEYIKRMDVKQTTPQQDQAALRAQLRNWQAVDHYFNGHKGPKPVEGQ